MTKQIRQYTSEILSIIDDELPRTDLEGVIMAVVLKIIKETK